jgi:hypothetical protein
MRYDATHPFPTIELSYGQIDRWLIHTLTTEGFENLTMTKERRK